MNVGQVIHRLRKEKKMTLLELSTNSGVALATLSRIENGKMTGTLDSHIQICRVLEVQLTDLYKDLVASTHKVEIKTPKMRTDVFVHDKKATSEMLAANSLTKKMMPTMLRLSKGGSTHTEKTKIGVEKFIYVLEGSLEAVIGEEKYTLSKGDTLYFESSTPHYFRNTKSGEARLISVVSPTAL